MNISSYCSGELENVYIFRGKFSYEIMCQISPESPLFIEDIIEKEILM